MAKTSFTLHDIPRNERPRERLLRYGVGNLSSQELLALILGRGIRGDSVMVTVQKLLVHFGSLAQLQEASYEDLRSIRGIGVAKACQLLACFAVGKRLFVYEQPQEQLVTIERIAEVLQGKIGHLAKEHLAVVSLTTRNRVIDIDIIAIGTLTMNVVHPREVFEAAIRRHAAKIIVSHNHPSGEVEPSNADLLVTQRLITAGNLIDIPVVDHIIVTKNDFFSIQDDKRT